SLFKSTDGGNTWVHADAGLSGFAQPIIIDPTMPTTLYAGTNSAGVFKSSDGGVTWTAAQTGIETYTSIVALAIDPQTPRILYVVPEYNQGVYRSTDSALKWSQPSLIGGELCGDGVACGNGSEACDDGNRVDGDGCDSNCTLTACGNGIIT